MGPADSPFKCEKTMRTKTALFLTILSGLLHTQVMAEHQPWVIDSQADWQKQAAAHTNLNFDEGLADPTARESTFRSRIKVFDTKRSARSIVFEQSAIWQNWEQVPNVGPSNLQDAPVVLCLGKSQYWMFGRYGNLGGKRKKGRKPPAPFKAEPTELEGFDVPLLTTPDPHQFNASGGLKKGKGGYHAWQSRDMVNWVHHGPVTEGFSRWVTSAEYVDGKCYIYYDYPNDQDPHVYVDDDLTDGVPGKNMGIAVKDPSDGSDSGVIRDEDGRFHVIFEDWSPISANKRSWDSPLAGHAVSHNGVSGFKIVKPAVDNRTKPTGKFATYKHPHWLQHPDWKSNIAKYEIHEPEQEAYGDWAAIRVGGQYYLFGDYDPVGGHQMAVGWFTSPSLDRKFTWCDKIGKGHPDPDIGFAEGKFYLITQFKQDFVSPGPWVEQVEARVGVDEDKDGTIDAWTKWQAVRETYRYKPGFAKLIDKSAASIDLTGLPAGHGFQFEFRMTDTTANKSKPMMDKVTLHFGDHTEYRYHQLRCLAARIEALIKHLERHALLLQLMQGIEEVASVPGKAVELGHEDDIALPRIVDHPAELVTAVDISAACLLFEHPADTGGLQLIDLEAERLRGRTHAGIAKGLVGHYGFQYVTYKVLNLMW